MDSSTSPAPAPGRYAVVLVAAAAALWMYIDRVCFSTLAGSIQDDLGVGPRAMSYALGAFFFTYALLQVPVGALADRYGPRRVLAGCVVGWSAATAATAGVGGAAGLLAARLLLGAAQAGAYPAATGLVRSWATATERGRFSSIVTLGGRVGGAVAPYLTSALAIDLAGRGPSGTARAGPGEDWRAVLILYGVCGLVVAGLLWAVVRDRPAAAAGEDPTTPPPRTAGIAWGRQLATLATSRNMWLSGATQFGVNVGWAFLVTLLPTYLAEVYRLSLQERGRMQSVALAVGCIGMLLGGLLTDRLASRLGPRWGRSLPLGAALLGCGAACSAVPWLSGPWAVVAALAVMAFLVDLSNPSIWAFNQDVGGSRTAVAAGWGNMWGNFGAALSPVLLGAVASRHGWPAAFATSAGFFVAAAACGLLLDAGRPLPDGPDGPT
jgi:MFS transporter, ACS family, glucarate transporter